VRPYIENRIKAREVKALFETRVKQITRDEVIVQNGAGEKRLPAKQVFALTGYHPDYAFIESLGVRLDPDTRRPALDPDTLESNVPGIHLAGVVIGGRYTGDIFIENGRFHGKQIIEALKA
jgi:thioredoxin reductase (NADPH)